MGISGSSGGSTLVRLRNVVMVCRNAYKGLGSEVSSAFMEYQTNGLFLVVCARGRCLSFGRLIIFGWMFQSIREERSGISEACVNETS